VVCGQLQDEVESLVADVSQGRLEQGGNVHRDCGAVMAGAVADHEGFSGFGAELAQRDDENRRVGLCTPCS